MELIEHIISLPPERYLYLLKGLMMAISAIGFTYIAVATGAGVLSVFFIIEARRKNNPLMLRWAAEMAGIAFPNRSIAVMLGALPLLCMAVIQAQILYGSGIQSPLYTLAALMLLIAAISVNVIYIRSFSSREERFGLHLSLGIASSLLFVSASLVYLCGAGQILFNGWSGASLFIANIGIRLARFIALSLAMASAASLCFRPAVKEANDRSYQEFVKQRAFGILAIFTAIQGALGFLVLLTLPPGAGTEEIAGPESFSLLLLLALMIMCYRSDLGFEMPVFIVLTVIVAITFQAMEINSGTAIRMHTKQLVAMARENEKKMGVLVPETVPEGKEIFRTACASCHAYDRRMTGPPMKEILPKYQGKPAELEAFIEHPKRVNPDYPPMPRPAILSDEIKAVSEYILGAYVKENEGGK